MRARGEKHGRYKDGRTGTSLYNVWRSMRGRCFTPSDTNYPRYGAKGITVCDEWDRSFEAFKAWAEAHGYAEGLTIERLDSAGNYEPGNCRWATRSEQNRNRSISTILTAFGESKTLADWAEDPRCAVAYGTLQSRIYKGWAHDRAITAPKGSAR